MKTKKTQGAHTPDAAATVTEESRVRGFVKGRAKTGGRKKLTPAQATKAHIQRLAVKDLREEIRIGMALAQTYAPGVLESLASIAIDNGQDANDRITAAKEVLQRAYGPAEMAAQAFAGMASTAPSMTVNHLSLPRDAALAILDRALTLLPVIEHPPK